MLHDVLLLGRLLGFRGALLLGGARDADDFDFGVVLPVAHLFAMVLAAAEFHDTDLVGAAVLDDLRGDECPGDQRRAERDALAFADHEHLIELDLAADVAGELVDADGFALRHAVLPTACNDDCVHDGYASVVILKTAARKRIDPPASRVL